MVLNKFQPDVQVNSFILLYFYLIEKFSVGKFLGQRFIHGDDVGLVLIYDSHGDIAGSQMAVS
jgi:hypothetical protein